MAWVLVSLSGSRRGELDAALRDDQLSRQSQKIRDAATAGGPAGELYVLIEGSAEAVQRAESLLGPLGKVLPKDEAERLYAKFKDEEENASAGMGLFFDE